MYVCMQLEKFKHNIVTNMTYNGNVLLFSSLMNLLVPV